MTAIQNKNLQLALLLFTSSLGMITAQTIDAQFDTLRAKSNKYKNFKVVPRAELIELQENTARRITGLKDSITMLETVIDKKETAIARLQTDLAQSQADRDTAIEQKSTFEILGAEIDKGLYSTIVWSVIGILLVILIILGIKYKSSHSVARDAERNLKTTEDELEELRRKSIEKEQRLGRQLQDERNKVARLKG